MLMLKRSTPSHEGIVRRAVARMSFEDCSSTTERDVPLSVCCTVSNGKFSSKCLLFSVVCELTSESQSRVQRSKDGHVLPIKRWRV